MKDFIDQMKEKIGYCPTSSKTCGNCGRSNFTVDYDPSSLNTANCNIFPPTPFKVNINGTCKHWIEKAMQQRM